MKRFTYILGSALIVIGVLVMAILSTATAILTGLGLAIAGLFYLIVGAILERQDRLLKAVLDLDLDPITPWATRYAPLLAADAAMAAATERPVRVRFPNKSMWYVTPDAAGGYELKGHILLEYPDYALTKAIKASLNYDRHNYRALRGWSVADIKLDDLSD